jgi:hypothetical protein
VRAGWGLGLVALIAAGGLLAGIALGSTPGARPVATRALGALPGLLPPGLTTTAPPSTAPAPPSTAPTSTAPTSTVPASTSTPPASTTAAPPPCAPTARACVDLSANQSWLLRDGRVTYGPVPITHGRTGFRTPPGTFRVASKRRDHVSSIYDAEMPWSVFFNGGIAFHEGSLTSQSHGCVRLSPTAAQTYFATLAVGDVVQVVP